MLTTFRQSFKTPVITQSDDFPLGLLLDMVVNPNTGIFEALWIKTLESQKLLLPKDIVHWNQERIIISDQNDLSHPEQLPKLNKIFEQECPILKNQVFDQASQRVLGAVSDFTFDTISPRLLALEVGTGLFGLKKQRIPQHRIIKIESQHITVDSSAIIKTDAEEVTIKKKIPVLEVPELDGPRQKEK